MLKHLSIILLLCSSMAFGQTKIREGSQTEGALPSSQGGVPAGGTTGQAQVKLSNADYDTGWSTISGAGGVTTWNTRSGAVVPVSGDYLASQVTNAADTTSSYSNPSWITALVWSKITGTPTTIAGYGITDAVPNTRTVNGHALSSNVSVTAGDVGAPSGSGTSSGTNTGDQDLSGLVPNTRTVNGHALSSNVIVTPTDLSLVIGTNVQAFNSNLTLWASLVPSANFQTMVPHSFSQMRSDLSLVPGTNVEAWSANLDAWGALATSSKQNASSEQTIGDADGTWSAGKTSLRASVAITANRAEVLPLAAGYASGTPIVYYDKLTDAASAFNRTFNVAGSDTVNGGASYKPFDGPGTMVLVSDGVSAWTSILDTSTVTSFRSGAKQGHVILSSVTDGQDRGMTWPDVDWSPQLFLTPTAVKTSGYTAVPQDFIPVDTTSGNITITLPTAPRNGTTIGIKQVIRGGTNTVTYACGGSDVLNRSGGSTSGTLTLAAQGVVLQYKSSGAIWYITVSDLPYGSLIANAQTWTGVQSFTAPIILAGSGTAASWPKMTSGILLTVPEAGAWEWDGAIWYHTSNATEGRKATEDYAYFALTADGSAIGPTIADFFGTGSAYPTVTNGKYKIIFDVYFTKTTAGTTTWTVTNSQTYANISGVIVGAPVGGIGTVGNASTVGLDNTTTAAAAFPVLSSETNATEQHFMITVRAECATAGTIKLQVTSGAGTVTPRRGSSIEVFRKPSANVGAWQ